MTAPSLEPDLVTFDVTVTDSSAAVRAVGEIDSTTAPLLNQHLGGLLDTDVRELTVDLGGVTFLDSAGLCALASSRAVVRPLQITGLWDLLCAEQVTEAGQVA